MHLPVLSNDFVFDDTPAIVENPLVSGGAPLAEVFTTNFWGGRANYEHVTTYRPLTTIVMRATWGLGGGSPAAFHGVNLLLHGLCVALVFGLVFMVSGGRMAQAVFSAGLFAVLPVHVEAIAGAVNIAELLTAAFYTAALLCALTACDGDEDDPRGGWWVGAVVLFLCAAFSKEHGLTWPAAFAVLYLHRRAAHKTEPRAFRAPTRPPSWALAGTVAVIAVYLGARWNALPALLGGDIPVSDNPMVAQDIVGRLSTAGAVYFHYLRLLVAPLHLSCDYSFNAIPVAAGPLDPGALVGLTLIIASVGLLFAALKRRPELAAWMALFAVLYALVSNLVILNTILLAERLMYLPSIAWCGLVGAIVGAAWSSAHLPQMKAALIAAVLIVGVGYGVRSVARTADWRAPVTLFRSSLESFPNSSRARYNIGRELLARGAYDEADSELLDAHNISPADVDTLGVLGTVRFHRARYADAFKYYQLAFAKRPNGANAANLCKGAAAAGAHEAAIRVCTAAADDLPGNAMVRFYLGRVLLAAGQPARAQAALEEAAAIEPDNPAIKAALAAARGR